MRSVKKKGFQGGRHVGVGQKRESKGICDVVGDHLVSPALLLVPACSVRYRPSVRTILQRRRLCLTKTSLQL